MCIGNAVNADTFHGCQMWVPPGRAAHAQLLWVCRKAECVSQGCLKPHCHRVSVVSGDDG